MCFVLKLTQLRPTGSPTFFLPFLFVKRNKIKGGMEGRRGEEGAAQENPLLRAKKRIGIDWPQPVLLPYPLAESRSGNLGAHSSVLNVCCFSLASRLSNGPKNSRPLLPFLLPSFIHPLSVSWPSTGAALALFTGAALSATSHAPPSPQYIHLPLSTPPRGTDSQDAICHRLERSNSRIASICTQQNQMPAPENPVTCPSVPLDCCCQYIPQIFPSNRR